MKRLPAIGVILILSGACLPLALFPFAHGYSPVLGFWGSLVNMEIHLWEIRPAEPYAFGCEAQTRLDRMSDPEAPSRCDPVYCVLPYRYLFAVGVLVFFGGLGVILLASMSREGNKVTKRRRRSLHFLSIYLGCGQCRHLLQLSGSCCSSCA